MRRDEIRVDTVARLKAAAPVLAIVGAADKVWDSRTTELASDEAPGINVLTPRTRWQQATAQGIPIYTRSINMTLECYVSVGQAAADDQAAADAELATAVDILEDTAMEFLLTDPEWVAQFEDVTGIDSNVSLSSDSKGRYGLGRVTFDLVTHHEYNPRVDPAATLDTVAFDTYPDGDTEGTPATEAEIPIEQGP